MLKRLPHAPSPNLRDYIYLIYSEPGIGKTTFAVESSALLLDFEAGYRAMEVYVISFVDSEYPDSEAPAKLKNAWAGACSWSRFLIFLEWAAQNGIGGHENLVVDTVDVAYESCVDFVCRKNGWSSPSDGGQYGKGWGIINDEFQGAMRRLLALGVGIGFTSHAKVRTVSPLGMEPVDKICPSLPPSCARWLVGLADFVLFAEAGVGLDGEPVRVIHTQPSTRFEAKSRGSKSAPLPSPIDLDWMAFQDAWHCCLAGEYCAPITLRRNDEYVAKSDKNNPWK